MVSGVRRSPTVLITAGVTMLALLGSGVALLAPARARPTVTALEAPAVAVRPPAPVQPALAPLPLHPQNDVTGATPWWSWALIDRRTGAAWGSANAEEGSRTASMVKAWLAALYLRLHPDPVPSWRSMLSVMIRDSNNAAADSVYRALGGNKPVIDAMWSLCGVTAFVPSGRWWASTTISSHEAARLGACIADGKVANATWTAWLLDEMRQVRGGGDFGIRWAFPEPDRLRIAVKNGWTSGWGTGWYVNCMGIGDSWVLVIETRSPSLRAGMNDCFEITRQLLLEPPPPDREAV